MNEILLIAACLFGMVTIWDNARRHGWAFAWQAPLFVLALSVPIAINFPIRSVFLDNRMIMALFVGFMYLRQPPGALARLRPLPSDAALLLLLVSMIGSEVSNRSVTPFGVTFLFLQWLPPYLLGRLFVSESRDLRFVVGPIAAAAVIWSLLSVVEGVTRINLWGKLFGVTPAEVIVEIRLGMQRAHGSQSHPISWGLTLAMLLPVMIEAGRRAKQGDGPRWLSAAPWLMIPGLLACGSRAAQLTAGLVVIANLYFLHPRIRAVILWAGLTAGLGFLVFRAEAIQLVGSMTDDVNNPDYVIIRGERHEYSGTKHRDLLYLVYQDAIRDAGLLGYGNPQENVPIDPYVDTRFVSVDNHFLHCYLHSGLLGLLCFCLFVLTVLGNLLAVLIRGGSDAGLATLLTGCMAGMLIAFRTVWLDGNFAWFFLWLCGISATLANGALNPAGAASYHQPHDDR